MLMSFTVLGPPQPKERARACADGRHRTPPKTRRYEKLVKTIASFSVPPGWPLDQRYAVRVIAYMPNARRRDCDNIAKSLLDGCNKVVWADDSQVQRLTVEREVDAMSPRCVVEVELLESEQTQSSQPKRVREAKPSRTEGGDARSAELGSPRVNSRRQEKCRPSD